MLKTAEHFHALCAIPNSGITTDIFLRAGDYQPAPAFLSAWPVKQAPFSVTETIPVNLAEFRMHSALTSLVRMHAGLYIEFFLAQRHR